MPHPSAPSPVATCDGVPAVSDTWCHDSWLPPMPANMAVFAGKRTSGGPSLLPGPRSELSIPRNDSRSRTEGPVGKSVVPSEKPSQVVWKRGSEEYSARRAWGKIFEYFGCVLDDRLGEQLEQWATVGLGIEEQLFLLEGELAKRAIHEVNGPFTPSASEGEGDSSEGATSDVEPKQGVKPRIEVRSAEQQFHKLAPALRTLLVDIPPAPPVESSSPVDPEEENAYALLPDVQRRAELLLGDTPAPAPSLGAVPRTRKTACPSFPVLGGERTMRSMVKSEPVFRVARDEALAGFFVENREFLDIELGGKTYRALFDTGATTTLIGPELAARYASRLLPSDTSMKNATGGISKILGHLPVNLEIDGISRKVVMKAVKDLDEVMILGIDFAKAWDLEIRLGSHQWRVGPNGQWKKFTQGKNSEAIIHAECAGVSELNVDQRKIVTELVARKLAEGPQSLGCTHLVEHHIDVQGAAPVKQKTRRLYGERREAAFAEVSKMLAEDIIEPSASDWSCAPVLVKKSDGSFRFCIDTKGLNAVTRKDAYPANDMNSILDKLREARYITKIDLKKAYHQIKMAEGSKKYTAFAVEGLGLFQFKRMPFGLCNAPAALQRLIAALFGPACEPHVFGYLDDLIIVTSNFEEHVRWLEFVIDRLNQAGLKINSDKCEFCCSQVQYLGYLLDNEGLRPDPEKVEPVVNYPAPRTVKQLRRFLGMVGWYSRFMPKDAEAKVPLFKLLKTETPWEWRDEQQRAFEHLKKMLTEAPVLARPDFTRRLPCNAMRVNLPSARCLRKSKKMANIPSHTSAG